MGSPGQGRRGAATVTGDVRRSRHERSHWVSRSPGKARRIDPGSQETCRRPPDREALVARGGHSMKHVLRGLIAAVLASAALVAPASAATVTVRVEGTNTTLIPLTTVTTAPAQIVKDGNS